MNPLKAFFIEPTGRQLVYLRRYRSTRGGDDKKCPLHGYHDVSILIGEREEKKTPEGYIESIPVEEYQDDPRWPVKCECGYEFNIQDDADKFQVFNDSIYRRRDTGEEFGFRKAPPGAIWNAWWLPEAWAGPDGLRLVAKTPDGHDWMIDGRASNCTEKCGNCGRPYHEHREKICDGFKRTDNHKCWTRNTNLDCLDVGKGYGPTCAAGAGSILTGEWHGFLRNGFFVSC